MASRGNLAVKRSPVRRSVALAGTALVLFSVLLQSLRLAGAPPVHAEDAYTLEISTASSASSVAPGGSVHDTATLVGDDGPAAGTITFFVCGPAEVTAAGCPSGGTQVGSPTAVAASNDGGTAQSADYMAGETPEAAGTYCWRAEYTPDPATEYDPEIHTDASAECFMVDAAPTDPLDKPDTDIQVTKTPDAGSVAVGATITWTIDVTNIGDGVATHVVMTDQLPPGAVWTENESVCEITGPAGSQVLTCNVGDESANHTRTYHVTGTADGSVCGQLTNTASATADLEADDLLGNNSDTGTVTVLCGLIAVTKLGNPAGPVDAGDQVGFDITVTNTGTATVTGVHVDDALPAGLDWEIASTGGSDCAITGSVGSQVLACDEPSMAPGDSFVTHIQALSDTADCGMVDNAVFVTSDNGGGAEATASVEVVCAAPGITKTADHAAPVESGGQIGFTVTVTNTAAATAVDLHVSDALDSRFTWTIESQSGALTWSLAGNQLSTSGDLPTGSSSVHVVATTPTTGTEAPCGPVPNTAFLTQGSGENATPIGDATAAETVLCAEPPSDLGIAKSNDAPIETIQTSAGPVGLPTAQVGDTITYTLTYTAGGVQHHGVITDVLPAGVTYVAGTATGSDEFSFIGFDGSTRTLRWEADVVTKGGTVSYDVTIDVAANELSQPLVNVATIVTDEQPADDANSPVFVGTVPQDLPPTDALGPSAAPTSPGSGLMLIVLSVAALALALAFTVPAPGHVRRRDRLR
jgi:uncharacterized repeat protein (TIGR01451 family)